MSEEKSELTIDEAIEAGYKFYTGQDFESCWPLKKAKDIEDFELFEWYLMEKVPTVLTIEPCDIYEDLADNFAINQEVADDDDKYHDLIIESVNWDVVTRRINKALAKHPVYFPTKIKLLTNGK